MKWIISMLLGFLITVATLADTKDHVIRVGFDSYGRLYIALWLLWMMGAIGAVRFAIWVLDEKPAKKDLDVRAADEVEP